MHFLCNFLSLYLSIFLWLDVVLASASTAHLGHYSSSMTSTVYPFSVHSVLAAMFSLHTFACASHYIAHLQPSTAAAAAATSSVVIDTWQRPLHTHTHWPAFAKLHSLTPYPQPVSLVGPHASTQRSILSREEPQLRPTVSVHVCVCKFTHWAPLPPLLVAGC